jgi:hypothetical protein
MAEELSYIAYLDILGTRSLIQANPLDFAKRFEQFVRLVEDGKNTPQLRSHHQLRIRAFQDSILLQWPIGSLSENDRNLALLNISHFLCYMLANGLDRNLALRGAVSCGTVYQSAHGIYGPCVSSAAHWHDNSEWIGVVYTPEMDKEIQSSPLFQKAQQHAILSRPDFLRQIMGPVVRYEMPVKEAPTSTLWVVDWPRYMAEQIRSTTKSGAPAELAHECFGQFCENFPPQTEAAKLKHQNTRDFIDFSLRKNPIPEMSLKMWDWTRQTRQSIRKDKNR